MRRRLRGWLVELSVDKGSARAAVTRGLECEKLTISLCRSRCQETASGDCNRLRTLVRVCQWSVKWTRSSEWCMQVVNKYNSYNRYPIYSHAPLKLVKIMIPRYGQHITRIGSDYTAVCFTKCSNLWQAYEVPCAPTVFLFVYRFITVPLSYSDNRFIWLTWSTTDQIIISEV
jgi:hypothetical protein